MDAKNTNITPWPKQGLSDHVRAAPEPAEPRPSREQAEAAVRTLIAYAGDNPAREGVLETPKRVIDAYEELYQGYRECPVEASACGRVIGKRASLSAPKAGGIASAK